MIRIKAVNEISIDSPEGILAMELLIRLTTTFDSNKTPDEVIELVSGSFKTYSEQLSECLKKPMKKK